jgi:FkbM family methyltransferase
MLRTKIIQHLVHFNERLVFYPRLKKFYASALKGKDITVIDVGVNKGQSIDFFKSINKAAIIFGFEPNKKLYDGLLHKYGKDVSISIINKGISDIEGKLLFHENIMDETSTFEDLNYNSEYLKKKARVLGVAADKIIKGSYEVEVTTLQHFIDQKGNVFFDVLKIDVEGHELQSLKGLFTPNGVVVPVRYIQIESHNDDMYLNNNHTKIEELLQANNFVPVAKIKHGFGDFHEIIYENKSL